MAKAKPDPDLLMKADGINSADLVSIEEAQGIFADRPDVAAVQTTEGTLNRDGTLTPFPV